MVWRKEVVAWLDSSKRESSKKARKAQTTSAAKRGAQSAGIAQVESKKYTKGKSPLKRLDDTAGTFSWLKKERP
jgi:hypothetical protein